MCEGERRQGKGEEETREEGLTVKPTSLKMTPIPRTK